MTGPSMNKRVACLMKYPVSVSTRAHVALIIKRFFYFPFQYVQTKYASFLPGSFQFTVGNKLLYRGADKSLARPTSRCILFDGETI